MSTTAPAAAEAAPTGTTNAQRFPAAERAFAGADLPTARSLFEAILDSEPDSSRARYGLAVCHMGLGNLDLAEQLLTEVEHAAPDANTSYQRALIAEHRQRNELAVALYRESLTRNPKHAAAAAALRRLVPTESSTPVTSATPEPHATAAVDYVALAQILDERDSPVPNWELPGRLLSCHHRSFRSLAGALFPAALVAVVLLALPAPKKVTISDRAADNAYAEVIDLTARLHNSWLLLTTLAAMVGVAYGVARYLTTTYVLFERRLDVREGIIRRREFAVWMYDVHTPPSLTQHPFQLLFDYATLVIQSSAAPQRSRPARRGQPAHVKLVGIGSHSTTATFGEEVRLRSLVERRRMVDRFMAR